MRDSSHAGDGLFSSLVVAGLLAGMLLATNALNFFRATHLIVAVWGLAGLACVLGGLKFASSIRTSVACWHYRGWVVGLTLVLMLHDWIACAVVGRMADANINALLASGFLLGLIALTAWSRPSTPGGFVGLLAAAVTVYVLINLVAFRLGLSGTQGGIYREAAATGNVGAERMIAPFGMGLNNFGIIAVFGATLGCLLAIQAIQQRSGLIHLLPAAVGMVINLYAVWRVEIRSSLVVILGTLAWGFVGYPRLRYYAGASLGLALFFFGPIYEGLWSTGMLDRMVGIYAMIPQRSEDEGETLNGRVFIWEEAFKMIGSGKTGWAGVGAAKRDFSAVYEAETGNSAGFTMTAHSSAIDLYVVYGPVLWGLSIVVLARMYWGVRRLRPESPGASDESFPVTGLAIACLGCGMMESFFRTPLAVGALMMIACGLDRHSEHRMMDRITIKTAPGGHIQQS
jgi:hypothetical protein